MNESITPRTDMLKTMEAVKHYRVAYNTFKKWFQDYGAPYHIIAGQRWFSITELDAWLKQH